MARIIAAVAALATLAGSLCAFDDTPAVGTDEIAALVKQLGDDDYDTREAAEKRLAAIGDPALPALLEASESGTPEAARRAHRLATRLTYRAENRKTLAPTLVTLDVELIPVRDVLAELTKQSKYPISLDANAAGDRASKTITVKVAKVPFWEAVLAVCDAADLRIHSVAGFIATDSRNPNTLDLNDLPPPPLPGQPVQPRFGSGARPVSQPATSNAIVLASRNGEPRRPSAVFGAVCVEAIRMPDGTGVPESAAALLNVWPEPKLNWIETTAVRLERAEDDVGQLLAGVADSPTGTAPQVLQQGNGVMIVKQVNGGVVIVNGNANVPSPLAKAGSFVPSIRQTVLKFKPGARPTTRLTDLRGSLFGTMRSGAEPLIALKGLEPGKPGNGTHPGGAQMSATVIEETGGKWRVNVDLSYDRAKVEPATGNNTVHGLKITDDAGNSFGISMTSNSQSFRGGSTWTTMKTSFTLYSANGTTGKPSQIAFLATYPKPVEVPFVLAGVPVVGGKK